MNLTVEVWSILLLMQTDAKQNNNLTIYHLNLLVEEKKFSIQALEMGVAFLDVLVMTYVTLHWHVSTALHLCPDNSLSFSISSVWHCAWEADSSKARLARFLLWAGRQERGRRQSRCFSHRFLLSLHLFDSVPSSKNLSSKFSLGSGFSLLQAGVGFEGL